uniref:Uncharacterized protein n=1 Tax=Arion vulgaris TaxID=1028688 RepID=A0A0B7B054_9EUPU
MVQYSQLVRADRFSENHPEHMRKLEINADDETNKMKRLTEQVHIVKHIGDKTDDYKRIHEHKEDSSIPKKKQGNLELTSRE